VHKRHFAGEVGGYQLRAGVDGRAGEINSIVPNRGLDASMPRIALARASVSFTSAADLKTSRSPALARSKVPAR
jgi:hypothetical protein